MYCKECGARVPDGAQFCKDCGAPVEPAENVTGTGAEDQAAARPAEEVPEEKPEMSDYEEAPGESADPEKKKKLQKIILIAASCLVAAGIAAGILLWIFLGQPASSQGESASQTESQESSAASLDLHEYTAGISPDAPEVQAGKTIMLTARINETMHGVSVRKMTWSSSDTSVAAVENGVVRGVREGSAEISVTYELSDGSETAAATTVTVTAGDIDYTVSVSPSSVSLESGGSELLEAEINQEMAEGVRVLTTTWNSSNTNVATVQDGRVTARSAGNATVTVVFSLSNGQSASASVPVLVTAPPVQEQAEPQQNTGGSSSYMLPNSNTQVISYDTLRGMTDYELLIARNEIYARHGRLFDDPDIQSYFNGKSWYHGTVSPKNFDTSVFSQTERTNIDRIVKVEGERKG